MTTDSPTPRSKNFVTSILPWLLGAGMFAVFLATLHHWVTPFGLAEVVDINGWSRGNHVFGPVAYLVTYPLRALPVSAVPLVLNLFSAVCAALTLCQLARSVALLPHDRTFEQRQREQSEFSVLTIPTAWVPPLFAVLACGLQMTFWENAIEATGEMFDLLLFAFVIRCLLEYRITQKESWMIRFALGYGLGMAENWAMVGFFPLFLAAVIWIKGLSVLKPGFLLRTAGLGLAGLSLFLLFPLLNQFQHGNHPGFWTSLHSMVNSERAIFRSYPREVVLLLSLTSLLPVFVISLRWASYFGDNSPLGIFMATSMFHIIHALFFLACIWVALDAPVSPRLAGYGLPFLTFYYLGALSIGYFSGYFLLIFGTKTTKSKMSLNPLLRAVNLTVTAIVWTLLVALPLILVRKNLPHIQSTKVVCRGFENYFVQMAKALPPQGAVVFCDDPPEPFSFRLSYLEATLRRGGKSSPHLLISASALTHDPTYLAALQKQNPNYRLFPAWTNIIGGEPAAADVIHLLEQLSQGHDLYYIHPSFGYFFERYYAEPQGLVYRLKPYPTNVWDAPLPTAEQIAANQAYWKQTFAEVLPPLVAILQQREFPKNPSLWEKLMDELRLKPERDRLALPLCAYYSRALDEWGVELQRAGLLVEAGKTFDQAGMMNLANISARINKVFNENLQAGKEPGVQPPKDLEEKLGQHRTWADILTQDGPIDEPNYRDELAAVMGGGGNYRQAVQHLNRVKEVAPHDLRAPLQLAQLFIYIQSYTNGLSLLLPYAECYSGTLSNTEAVLRQAPNEPTALFLKGVALIQLKAYDQAIEPLNHLLSMQTNNYAARLDRAIAYFKVGNLDAAKPDYEAVQRAAPNAYQADFGLGEIAYKQNDKAAAIKNYEFYLTNAPPKTAEAALVAARLKELKSGAPAP